MALQCEVLEHCLEEAALASRPALARCLEQAIAALQLAETQSFKVAERDALSTAWQQLHRLKPQWLERYPVELKAAFSESAELASRPTQAGDLDASRSARSSFDSRPAALGGRHGLGAFSLVEDADVVQAIASGRLLQQILPRVDRELAVLDALISSAQGLANVRPELNPLRPDVFIRVLQGILNSAGADETVFAHWVRHLADPLGRELKLIYDKLTGRLERAHVQAAQYRVRPTPAGSGTSRLGGLAPASGGFSGPGSAFGGLAQIPAAAPSAAPSQYADLSNYEIKDELFREFLFGSGSDAHHGLAPAYYESVDQELAALKAAPDAAAAPFRGWHDTASRTQRDAYGDPDASASTEDDDMIFNDSTLESAYRQQPAVDRPVRPVDASSALSSALWGSYGPSHERALVRTQLKKEATRVGQVLGLEVVRKLVNQVAMDPRLLGPVREAIVALEPSLLRLAMVDPRFFSDESHAGRQLMERVAQRSFKYNDEFSPEFTAFFSSVCDAINVLNSLIIESALPFGRALATLESNWATEDEQDLRRRRVVLHALRFAEERQDAADQIAFNLSARSDLEGVPGVVLNFLFGPWALAMAHARLVDERNQFDPEGFGSVVPDLLWSVKREVTLKRPAKLFEMIPGLIEKLKSGLAMLGEDPRENQNFFESLMKLHQPVLRLRRLKTQRDAEESGAMPLEGLLPEDLPATPDQRQARAAGQPWLGRDELDVAGFEDTQPTAPADLAAMEAEMEQSWRRQQAIESGLSSVDAEPEPVADAGSQPAPEPAAGRDAALVPEAGEGYDVTGRHDESGGMPAPGAVTATDAAVPAASVRDIERAAQLAKEQAEATLQGLRTGDWVDLYSRRRWVRAQLIWASSKGTLFMFLSHGGQPHSMTRRSCEKLIVQRLLRPVNGHSVVARALDAVVHQAW
ncbi:MAG: hypothetical protein JWP47_1677 [Polaromonas sp.]|nr:hypothetical protein [Polaromonas sp.]